VFDKRRSLLFIRLCGAASTRGLHGEIRKSSASLKIPLQTVQYFLRHLLCSMKWL